MMEYPEYRGLSYERASREASAVIERYGWYQGFKRLTILHQIMATHLWGGPEGHSKDCLAPAPLLSVR